MQNLFNFSTKNFTFIRNKLDNKLKPLSYLKKQNKIKAHMSVSLEKKNFLTHMRFRSFIFTSSQLLKVLLISMKNI